MSLLELEIGKNYRTTLISVGVFRAYQDVTIYTVFTCVSLWPGNSHGGTFHTDTTPDVLLDISSLHLTPCDNEAPTPKSSCFCNIFAVPCSCGEMLKEMESKGKVRCSYTRLWVDNGSAEPPQT